MEDVRFYVDDQKGKLSRWFSDIVEWKNNQMDNNRVVWTKWFGVPLEAWAPRFFKLLSVKLGTIIKIDEDTLLHQNLQFARILIKTPYGEIPKEPIQVMIDGKIHKIRIREEEEKIRGDARITESHGRTLNPKFSEEVNSDGSDNSEDEAGRSEKVEFEKREILNYGEGGRGNVKNFKLFEQGITVAAMQ